MRSVRNLTLFFSCDVRKGHHSKARSIESIVRSKIIGMKMSSFEEFSVTSSEEYPSLSSSADFRPRIVIRRNLMHADSFLYISRVAASKNHTFFNHFLCLTIKHYRESSHIFARCPFLTSRSIFGHIWPSGGLMRTIGENIDKTAFTFSTCK